MITSDFKDTLQLTNDGKLSLFFIGTGSAFSKKYFQTNFLVVKGNDHILIDCGTLCTYALEKIYNTSITSIQNIFITHPHADHIGSLEEFALAGRYVAKKKLNLIINDKFKKILWKQSVKGGLHYSEDGHMKLDDYFNQIKPEKIARKPFEMYEANVGGINLKIFRTRHITTKAKNFRRSQLSYGVLIDNRILCTGDSQFTPEYLNYFQNNFPVEQIIHDCDVSGLAEGVHASYRQLETLDTATKAKMMLVHYNSSAEKKTPEADGFMGFVKPGIWYIF